jgi:uncharacterized protein (DUF433 family)
MPVRSAWANLGRSIRLSQQNRITSSPDVMDGEPVIRHLALPVSLVQDLIAAGLEDGDILGMYPDLESADLAAVKAWAAAAPEA